MFCSWFGSFQTEEKVFLNFVFNNWMLEDGDFLARNEKKRAKKAEESLMRLKNAGTAVILLGTPENAGIRCFQDRQDQEKL